MARVAVSNDALQAVRLLRIAGFLDRPLGGATPRNETADRVGIWEPKLEDGQKCFVRSKDAMPEWIFWANVPRIEPKGKKLRVVLIGESVARGYFYDPLFNPALALQTILDAQFGKDEFEVIDLARINLCHAVKELAINALQLEPDIAIVFAGNNWCTFDPDATQIAETDEALAKDGIAGAKRVADKQSERTARDIAGSVAAAYRSNGVPLVWIIPEYNLRDWRDPITNAPHLPRGLNREWLSVYEKAERALRDRDLDNAAQLAQRLVEIDQGVCVAGLYILAECSLHKGDLDGARKYLELAKDAPAWDRSRSHAPKPYTVIQQALREEAARHDFDVVDLPQLFKEHLQGELPDRRLFLDYCHLTTRGIQIAMGAAAACVLRRTKNVETSWQSLIDMTVALPPETEAEAMFLAAIMTAHWSPSYEVVRYYAARALSLSPHMAELMLNYIELQNRSEVPMLMSAADEQLHKLGSRLVHHYLLRLNEKRLDSMLCDALVDALEEVGVAARERLNQLRREQHSVSSSEINLLDYYYCSAANQQQELAWASRSEEKRYRPPANYYKAYWPESRFVFVGEAGSGVRLSLTCRLPQRAPAYAPILISVNGEQQAEIVIGREWTTWDINLPGDVVRDGVNEIAISWPIPEFAGGGAFEKARLDLS